MRFQYMAALLSTILLMPLTSSAFIVGDCKPNLKKADVSSLCAADGTFADENIRLIVQYSNLKYGAGENVTAQTLGMTDGAFAQLNTLLNDTCAVHLFNYQLDKGLTDFRKEMNLICSEQ